jgi:hypothetical protein
MKQIPNALEKMAKTIRFREHHIHANGCRQRINSIFIQYGSRRSAIPYKEAYAILAQTGHVALAQSTCSTSSFFTSAD